MDASNGLPSAATAAGSTTLTATAAGATSHATGSATTLRSTLESVLWSTLESTLWAAFKTALRPTLGSALKTTLGSALEAALWPTLTTTLLIGIGAAWLNPVAGAQTSSGGAAPHVAAAKAAAGQDHLMLFNQLCSPPPASAPARQAAAGPAPAPAPGPPARAQWHAEPAKIFDNLYFVGMTEYTAWAVTTSDGIIVIDPLFDYSVEDEVVGGLRKLGLDPANIEYVLVSHGHLDHVGGAKLLQERFGARVLLAAADWDMLERDNPPYKPRRDIEITDGMKLTLGDTTLTMYHTP